MGDLDIDVSEGVIMAKKHAGFVELGGFQIYKANNGFIVHVGSRDGMMVEDAYVCKEANEIGDLITAHIVGQALED